MNVDSVGVMFEGDSTSLGNTITHLTGMLKSFSHVAEQAGHVAEAAMGGGPTGVIGALKGMIPAGAAAEGALGGLLAMLGAVAAAAVAVGIAIKEYAGYEYALAGLRSITSTNTSTEKLQEGIEGVSREFRRSEESVISLMTRLRQFGVEEEKLTQTTRAVMALSKGTGMGEFQAFRALEQFQQTGTSMLLTRYIPALKNAQSEAEKTALIQDRINKGMSINAAESFTISGA